MKEFSEIGGSFWLSTSQLSQQEKAESCNIKVLQNIEYKIFTSSGRGAIKLLLKNFYQNSKIALLPAYTCDSVLKPFRETNFNLHFYGINKDLSVNLVDLLDKIEKFKPGVIYMKCYFVFDTIKNLRPYYKQLQSQGIIIIEDITHSWLSNFDKIGADFYISSFRKWLEIPDGGVLLSIKNEMAVLNLNLSEHCEVIGIFRRASQLKNEYVITMKPEIKETFRPLFYKIESLLDFETNIYSLSKLTASLLNETDLEKIIQQRQKNFISLLQGISKCKNVTPVFNSFPDGITPLYFPVYVLGDRDKLQKKLAQEGIYCPVIWPIPIEVINKGVKYEENYPNRILSIPCDQRYTPQGMEYIISILGKMKDFK